MENKLFCVSGNSGTAADVTSIVLEDGTRCAVLIGWGKGAISCDWNHK